MPVINKPNDLSTVWSSSGDIVKPTPTKISTGWEVEVPPRQWFNWLDNRQDQAIAHINQHGIAAWDSNTEYQAGKSLVMGSDGVIYKSTSTGTGQDPIVPNSLYWKQAFATTDGQVLEVNGETRLGGGLTLKWGTSTVPNSGNTSSMLSIVFPIPFTATCFAVFGNSRGPANSVTGNPPVFMANGVSTNGFTANLDTLGSANFNQTVTFNWWAIGV